MQQSSSVTPYRREAVSVGPFAVEPMELGALLFERPDGSRRTGDEIRAAARAWLTSALDEAGVVLGEHDHAIVTLFADDGWSIVQVVAGWIARAGRNRGADRGTADENGRGPPEPGQQITCIARPDLIMRF